MKLRLLALAALAPLVLGCSAAPRSPAKLADAYLALVEKASPETATQLGHHHADRELDDRSVAAEHRRLDAEKTLLDELRAAKPATPEERTDLALLVSELDVDLARTRWERPLARRPDLYASPLNAIYLMVARDYAPAKTRAENVLARLRAVPAVVAHAKANLVPRDIPRSFADVGLDQAKSAKEFFTGVEPELLQALPGREAEVKDALAVARGAYDDYAAFLEKSVLPEAKGSFAIGKPAFDHLLHASYHLEEDADQIRAIGERVFQSTKEEILAVARRIDPQAKTHLEVVARVKKKHPAKDALLPTYRKEVSRVRAFLVQKDAVPFPAGEECDVVDTPPFLRSTITAAYDQAPPFDPVTKGLFFLTPIDPKASAEDQEAMLTEHDLADVVNTAVHEVYPGHHLQLSFARVHPSLARKITGTSIFAEGWALYTEELLHELGYYDDEQRLMQLSWTLVRAMRVMLDVDLHTRGLSQDDAVRRLVTEIGLAEPHAKSEVRRYVMMPTQPLSYLVGRERIRALRDAWMKREGAKGTLKRFHEDLLSRGTVAPDLLRREMGL